MVLPPAYKEKSCHRWRTGGQKRKARYWPVKARDLLILRAPLLLWKRGIKVFIGPSYFSKRHEKVLFVLD